MTVGELRRFVLTDLDGVEDEVPIGITLPVVYRNRVCPQNLGIIAVTVMQPSKMDSRSPDVVSTIEIIPDWNGFFTDILCWSEEKAAREEKYWDELFCDDERRYPARLRR
jgi:hypothetical protein